MECQREVRVHLPVPYAESTQWVTFCHRSNEWCMIDTRHVIRGEVRIPEQFVGCTSRVKDQARHVIGDNGELIPASAPIRAGSVALVLESPHEQEFDEKFHAKRPLNNPSSERLLVDGIKDLLQQAEALSGVRIAGRQLALFNAIQYQCSLQYFLRPGVRNLQRCIRDTIWSAMFDAGGREDLLARLAEYPPALVILAPTRMVRKALVDSIGTASRAWPWLVASSHPTAWRPPKRLPRLLPLQSDGSCVVMPGDVEEHGPISWIDRGSKPYECAPMTDSAGEGGGDGFP